MRIGNIKNRGTLYNFLLSSQLSRRVHLACIAVRKTLREREEESERETRERNENPFWPLRLRFHFPHWFCHQNLFCIFFLLLVIIHSSHLGHGSVFVINLKFPIFSSSRFEFGYPVVFLFLGVSPFGLSFGFCIVGKFKKGLILCGYRSYWPINVDSIISVVMR